MILKWAFIDLDGTLLNQRKRIPKKNLIALKEYVDKKGNIVITTGRWPISALKINKKIEKFSNHNNKYLIAMNGANIYDLKENKIIYEKEINLDIFNAILEKTKQYNISAWIYSEKGIKNKTIYSVKIPIKKIISKFNYGKIVELKKRMIQNDKVFKVLFLTWRKKEMNKFIDFLKTKYEKDLLIVKITSKAIEVTAKNTSKGEAIKIIQKIEKFKLENTVALGDSQNDLSMFRICNYKVCFNSEEKNLSELANISFRNQSKFYEAFQKWIIPYQSFKKTDLTLKLNLNNWYEKFNNKIIKTYKNFWNYLSNQGNLIIETSFPIWMSKNILNSFLIDKNIKWTNENTTNLTQENILEIKKYLEKNNEFKILVVENNNGCIIVYRDEKDLNLFIKKNNLSLDTFNKIFQIKNFQFNKEINSKTKNISLDNLNFFKNKSFQIFKSKNMYHLYTKEKNKKEKNNKKGKIKEFNINNNGIEEMLKNINSFLN